MTQTDQAQYNMWSHSGVFEIRIRKDATPEDLVYVAAVAELALGIAKRMAEQRQWEYAGYDPISMGM